MTSAERTCKIIVVRCKNSIIQYITMIIETNSTIKFNHFHPLLNLPGEKKSFSRITKIEKNFLVKSVFRIWFPIFLNVLIFDISFAISKN